MWHGLANWRRSQRPQLHRRQSVGRRVSLAPSGYGPRVSTDARDTIVFIPAWNEEDNLPDVLEELHAELPDAHVLVVDDGSTDRTAAVAADHGAEVLSFGEQPRPAGRHRGRLRARCRAGLRLLRPHRRRRAAPAGRAAPPARARALRGVRRRRRLALRQRRRLRGLSLRARGHSQARHRAVAPRDAVRARPAVPRRDERPLRGGREGAADPRPAVHERRARGGGDSPARSERPARARGPGRHARARVGRVEAAGKKALLLVLTVIGTLLGARRLRRGR